MNKLFKLSICLSVLLVILGIVPYIPIDFIGNIFAIIVVIVCFLLFKQVCTISPQNSRVQIGAKVALFACVPLFVYELWELLYTAMFRMQVENLDVFCRLAIFLCILRWSGLITLSILAVVLFGRYSYKSTKIATIIMACMAILVIVLTFWCDYFVVKVSYSLYYASCVFYLLLFNKELSLSLK